MKRILLKFISLITVVNVCIKFHFEFWKKIYAYQRFLPLINSGLETELFWGKVLEISILKHYWLPYFFK